ncbi:MAG: ubiquinol-cytochrome C chaperone family protein [Pseudomonadota bacterium]
MAWFQGRARRKIAEAWHRNILRLARTPAPFASGWIDDSFEGRFQMVTLVSTLVLRRIRTVEDGTQLADLVYREVFSGLDHAFREEGVGDATIARKMRGLGEEFFGLAKALDADFTSSDTVSQITATIDRNGIANPGYSGQLAEWVVELEARLGAAADSDVQSADLPDAVYQP